MTTPTPPQPTPDEATPPADTVSDNTVCPLNRNGGHWALGLMVMLVILLVFFRADKDAGDAAPSLVNTVAWGAGAVVSIVGVLFARTFVFRRLGLGLLMIFFVGGFSRAIDYYYPGTHIFSLALALALALLATVGLARRRSWSDARYGRQAMIVRVLCVLLLVGGGVVIAQLTNRIKANQEAEFLDQFLGVMEHFKESVQPTYALMDVLKHDDSLTTTQRVQRVMPLVDRQIALMENLQKRVQIIKAPRKYRKVQGAYVQALEVTIDSQRDMKQALPQDDVDLIALCMENFETGVLPALRIFNAELREAGFEASENEVEEIYEKSLRENLM